MTARTLMVMGASSSAGKSLLVTALCRIYARRGWKVAPFKAQNMSNNAAVCRGGEIGRAQAVQAFAAGIEPSVEMNPVLLKPEADHRSQVVVLGKVWETLPARRYYDYKQSLWQVVASSLDQLRAKYDLVVIEGAGSPAELNLHKNDIVNLAVARYARSPSLLVGDIDRGGVFAQLLGTLWLLEPEDRRLIRGLIVNKFRGDIRLFTEGVKMLEERGGAPVLGVVPYLHDHGIAEEDAVAVEGQSALPETGGLDLVVIRLPRISNFDDFDPLVMTPGVRVRYVDAPEWIRQPHAILLPGTKSTMADLLWLHERGLSAAICALARRGTPVVGVCGGYQMLGERILDPLHVESSRDEVPGLNLLPIQTTFAGAKAAYRSEARVIGGHGFWQGLKGQTLSGYEIHMGQTAAVEGAAPDALFEIIQREGMSARLADGFCSPDGRIFGCYLHGLFDHDGFRRAWLASLVNPETGDGAVQPAFPAAAFGDLRRAAFDRLADAVESALDMARLDALLDEPL